MFNNNVGLNLASSGSIKLVSLTDTDNGRSVRRNIVSPTERYEFAVSNQLTGDNSPMQTESVMVRVDHIKYDAVLLKEIKQSAYIVMKSPAGDFTSTQMVDLVCSLVSFLNSPDQSGDFGSTSWTQTAANMATTTNRILAGEL
jgi:flavorubredoxin